MDSQFDRSYEYLLENLQAKDNKSILKTSITNLSDPEQFKAHLGVVMHHYLPKKLP